MKQQIIEFMLDYKNSGLTIAEWGAKKNLTENECRSILDCGIELSSPPKWVQHKNLILKILEQTGMEKRALAAILEVKPIAISEVLALKRGIPEKKLHLLDKYVAEHKNAIAVLQLTK